MLELLYINKIVELIDQKTNITSIPMSELAPQLKIRPSLPFCNFTIKEIDYKKKSILDHLIRHYGQLGSLLAIKRIQDQAIKLSIKASESSKPDFHLFITACKNLYGSVEKYYMTNIFYKMILYFTKLKNENFDATDFFQNITKEKNYFPYNDSDETEPEQLSLSAFQPASTIISQANDENLLKFLGEAIYLKENSINGMVRYLKTEFTKDEIYNYATTLIDMLNAHLSEEYAIIVQTICRAVDQINKTTKAQSPKRPGQIKMMQFNQK